MDNNEISFYFQHPEKIHIVINGLKNNSTVRLRLQHCVLPPGSPVLEDRGRKALWFLWLSAPTPVSNLKSPHTQTARRAL